jgi:hypothetical protein
MQIHADSDPQQTTLPIPVKLLYSTGNIVSNVQFVTSVVDPHHFETDPEPDADPDSDFYLMRIRIFI